jgi:hypothetical protein
MKNLAIISLLMISLGAYSQQVVDLQENTPYENNGIEYGYYISNESSREVKGEDFERYEINLYVTNKSGCIRLLPLRTGSSSSGNKDQVQVAEFNCTNATGKRLTAKKGAVAAKPWFTMVKIPDESTKEKSRIINAQAGYAIRSGETLTTRIIVIVPKDQKPTLNCRMIYLPELQ